ncbi:MAG: hypothetical protein AB2L14_25465 [Candidatus Xenobiia bacterium LiM19]
MTTSEKLKRLEEIVISHLCNDEEDEKEATALFADLQRELKTCGKACESWYQTDTLTPAAGRCKRIQCGGVNRVTFEGEECHGNSAT